MYFYHLSRKNILVKKKFYMINAAHIAFNNFPYIIYVELPGQEGKRK